MAATIIQFSQQQALRSSPDQHAHDDPDFNELVAVVLQFPARLRPVGITSSECESRVNRLVDRIGAMLSGEGSPPSSSEARMLESLRKRGLELADQT